MSQKRRASETNAVALNPTPAARQPCDLEQTVGLLPPGLWSGHEKGVGLHPNSGPCADRVVGTGRSHARFRVGTHLTLHKPDHAGHITQLLKHQFPLPPDSTKTDDRHSPVSSPGRPGTTCQFPGLTNAEEGHQRLGRLGVQAWSSVLHSSPRCQTHSLHSSRPASHRARCSKGLPHVPAARAPALGSPSSPVGGTGRRWVSREPGSPPAASPSSVLQLTAGSWTAPSGPLLEGERLPTVARPSCFSPHLLKTAFTRLSPLTTEPPKDTPTRSPFLVQEE